MEMACHPSYPLNSENASPPGTFTVYLSCAEMASTASNTVIVTIVSMILFFIAGTPLSSGVLIALARFLVIAHACATIYKSTCSVVRRTRENVDVFIACGCSSTWREHGKGDL